MKGLARDTLKTLLGDLPYTAEVYWRLRQPGKPLSAEFSLDNLQERLPAWCAQATDSPYRSQEGKRILLFGMLRYWIEHTSLLGVTLAGLGHKVGLAYLPYARWQFPLDRFTTRRHNLYAQSVLRLAEPLIDIVPFYNGTRKVPLPDTLEQAVRQIALRDTQYTLQVEDVNLEGDLYKLRLERNRAAADTTLSWMKANRPDVVIIPNGTILEFGAVYQAARYLNLPVVTYEFGEQRQRVWLAQDAEVMHQDTYDLWERRKDCPLSVEQLEHVRQLFAARQRASLWENFARRWQGVPSEGGERARANLGLDGRPLVLLATNVIGDSLTLGRQVFSDSMTEWLTRTVQFFAQQPLTQLVVRIHPGELITKGPSVADVVKNALPEIPPHIHLVAADAPVNTYDLVEIADLGLVYTTTVGLEMVLSGVPVIVIGNTHYRNRGFTLDPDTWESYFDLLSKVLLSPAQYRPTQEGVSQAWNYAYRFFFEYPHPFPWHIVHAKQDLKEWPVARVLSAEGQSTFGNTFRYLVGEPIEW